MALLATVGVPVAVGRIVTSPLQLIIDANPPAVFSTRFRKTANSFRKTFISSQSPILPAFPSQAGVVACTAATTMSVADKADKELKDVNIRTQPSAGQIQEWVEEIRGMFRSMTDGEITVSPYDTAWVALIPAMDGSSRPEFPKSLQWILNNQLEDGSWGVADYFSYYDRILNSFACVVALQTWGADSSAVRRGLTFIWQNLELLGTEQDAHMMIGFEVAFPAIMKEAKKLGLDLPYNSPAIMFIDNKRQKKLAKIPMDVMHKVPTSILFTLEGFHEEVDWNRMLKLQSRDGSFTNSPAATAACLLHTRDEKALNYLKRLVARFDNAVPNTYPVDLFERMWIVDRIQRLGIHRYFQNEIKESLDYVYKHFADVGISWTRGASIQDLDDTAMGFRLLRQHGYDVSENVFKQFKTKNGEFVCFAGQTKQAITPMFNFHRAAQTRFAEDTLLAEGEAYARAFLEAKVAANECHDKWVIAKDLVGEVRYALDTPWLSSLPLVETSSYLKQYGPDDIWIGKSLYRMPFIHNETFLALAKADYNMCQSIHRREIPDFLRWNKESEFDTLTFARQTVYESFFGSVLIFPAPELSKTRAAFTKASITLHVLDDLFDGVGDAHDLGKFVAATKEWDLALMIGTSEEAKVSFKGFHKAITEIIREATIVQNEDVGAIIRKYWTRYVQSIAKEAEWIASNHKPSMDEYLKTTVASNGADMVLLCGLAFSGEQISNELTNDPTYLRMTYLVDSAGRLINDVHGHKGESKPNAVTILMRENPSWTEEEAISKLNAIIQGYMRELVQIVHGPSHIPRSIKQAHFDLARTTFLFFKDVETYCHSKAIKALMRQILFEPVS